MATFYRIEKRRHLAEAYAGLGGLFTAGRWHRKGVRVSYASEHQAVAVLEKLAWLGSYDDAVGGDYVVVPIGVPDALIEVVAEGDLSAGWDAFPHSRLTQEIGMRWLRESRTVALRVPSAVVPRATNVLINPLHPDMASLDVGRADAFDWDPRLFSRGS